MKTLTSRQRAFIAAYAGNGTAAAIAAGYDAATAAKTAHRLLRMPEVAAALQAREAAQATALVASRTERLATLTRWMRDEEADLGHRLRALELLGRAHGDFLDRSEITGTLVQVIDPYAAPVDDDVDERGLA